MEEDMRICDGTLSNNELDDVDHLCCMAHARAKFKYAYEQGGDERALSFLEWIGQLYGFEEEYKMQDLPPEEIKRRRNDSSTTDIMIAMSSSRGDRRLTIHRRSYS